MNLLKTRLPFFAVWPEFASLEGVRVPIKNSPLDPRSRRRLLRGSYEPAERDLLSKFVEPGDQILELGASIGIVSSFLRRTAGPPGKLVSVEADARLKPAFDAQLAANGLKAEWVNALACPIWAERVPPDVAAQSFASSDRTLSGRASSASTDDAHSPPWMTASEICRMTSLQPTAVMIDIEGSEAVWARRAPKFPPTVRLVLVEFHARLTGSDVSGKAAQAVIDEGFQIAGLRDEVVAFRRSSRRGL